MTIRAKIGFPAHVAVALILPVTFDGARAALIHASDEPASLATGEAWALADKVRQVQFDITGGSILRINGTATPLGPWYSGLSKHYFDYVRSSSGSSEFTILVATGATWNTRSSEIPVARVIEHPTLDFVLLEHTRPVSGAAMPTFGSIARFDMVTFVGYGIRQLFFQTGIAHDGKPAVFTQRVINTSSSSNYVSTASLASPIPGGGLNFDSSSPGYNSSGLLCCFLDNGTNSPNEGFATCGSIPFVASGLAAWVDENTPLNKRPTLHPELTISIVANNICQIQMANLTVGTHYRIMRSTTVSAWQESHHFTSTGSSESWSDQLAPEGAAFYRLEWEE